MDSNFEKYKKRVYVEKTNINEVLKLYNNKFNILPVPTIMFLCIAIGIMLIEMRWDFGIGGFVLIPLIPFVFCVCILARYYIEYKKVLNEYREKIELIKNQFEKDFIETVNDDATFSQIKKSKEYKKEIEDFFADAKEPETVVYIGNKTILMSVLATVAYTISDSYSFTPKRWKTEPEKRAYMAQDIKTRLNMTFLSDKYNLYSLNEDEIAELFYIEGQKIPEIDFKFYSDYETYNAHYMYTENGINYWVITIHQGNFREIDFIKSGDIYIGTLRQSIDEPDVMLEERPPLMPDNFKK